MFGENTFGQQQEIQFKIDSLMLSPVSGYKDMFLRPYNVNLNNNDLIKLENLLDKAVGSTGVPSLSNIELANTLNVLEPSSTGIKKTNIVGGWGQERFVFLLTVRWLNPITLTEEMLYLTGYTDYPEANINTGAVSEKMRLFPNTAILLRRITGMDGRPTFRISSTFTIEFDAATQNYTYNVEHELENADFLIRPYDAMKYIEELNLGGMALPMESTTLTPNTIDREDFLPSEHLNKTINGLMTSVLLNGDDINHLNTFKNASIATRKSTIQGVEFFVEVLKSEGQSPGLSFPISFLKRLDPSMVPDILPQAPAPTMEVPNILTSTESEETYIPTIEAKMSTLIRDAISTLIAKNMLMEVSMSCTNNTMDSSYVVTPHSAYPIIPDVETAMLVEKFKIEFINLVFPQLTHQNQMLVNIHFFASVLGETRISISVNQGPAVNFIYPTFADSLYNSLVTTKDNFMDTSHTYKQIVDTALNKIDPASMTGLF